MIVSLQLAWLLKLYFISIRLAGLLLLAPVLSFTGLPRLIRVVTLLVLSATLASVPGVPNPDQSMPLEHFVVASVGELIIGALIGAPIRMAFGAFEFGGQLVDFQVGFNAGALFNPSTQVQSSIISASFGMLGSVLFVLLDLHLILLRGLGKMLQSVPPGSLPTGINPALVVAQFGLVFVYGFALVAPVVLGLMLADIVIAVTARAMPQLNVYFVSLPMKIFLGLYLLALSMTHIGPLAVRLFERALHGTI